MKIFIFVLIAASSAALTSQTAAPTPSGPDQLFQLPQALSSRSPYFKLQMDANAPRIFNPRVVIVNPSSLAPDLRCDPGIVKHPPEGSFAVRPAITSGPQNLYPDLKIQPTELAGMTPLPAPWLDGNGFPIPITWPNAKMIPIPITWPDAKMIPIPRNVDGFKGVEIRSPRPDSPSVR